MTDPLRNLAPGATFKLPSIEQMRREMETGEFSSESIAVARDILESVEPADLITEANRESDHAARVAKAKARDEEQAKLYQEKLDMGLLVGSGVRPNLKEISKHFVKQVEKTVVAMNGVTKAARKAEASFKEMGEKLSRVKKEYVPQPHLTHRPFKTPEMQRLRDSLR